MAKKPYTTTVIIWAETPRAAMIEAEKLTDRNKLTFTDSFVDTFASESYETHPAEIDLFEHFGEEVTEA